MMLSLIHIWGGSILYTCNLPLRNVPLRRLFHQLSDLPLYIENDANCAALAEYYVGGGRGSKRFITEMCIRDRNKTM